VTSVRSWLGPRFCLNTHRYRQHPDDLILELAAQHARQILRVICAGRHQIPWGLTRPTAPSGPTKLAYWLHSGLLSCLCLTQKFQELPTRCGQFVIRCALHFGSEFLVHVKRQLCRNFCGRPSPQPRATRNSPPDAADDAG
jgi:hypothetical protein